MTATLFQAAKDGNLELVSSLLHEASVDIDARDDAGLTALHHAVRANHLDVVSQLLAKGANAAEVAQDVSLKHNPELAAVINNALQHTQSTALQNAPVVDSHGGKQLPDGTVSYVQPPAHPDHSVETFVQQQHPMHHPISQPIYPFQAQNNFFDPSQNPDHRAHAPKEGSSGSLPPPEVARFIPCRYYPNCRYADKCIFAHPVAMPASAPNAGLLSPGQAPMFYQSHAYGYPAYGPPQHFYSMAPPMPLQYTHAGVPMPVHMPPPHHMAPAPLSVDQTDAYGQPYASQPHQQAASDSIQEGEPESVADKASQDVAADSAAAATPADSEVEKGGLAGELATTPAASNAVPTTSFSAFMAHHATPFQPGPGAQNSVTVGADGSLLTGSQSFSRGTKGARRGGASMNGSFGSRSEFSKRSNERPACSFFARSACKHGEDCRFPHILPDGTDARGPNAGRSNHSIEASRAISRALAAKTARASTNGSPANNSNAAQSSQIAMPTTNGNSSSLPPSSTNVTVSTSPASAQTTITSAQEAEDIAKPSTDKAASREEATEKSASTTSTITSAAGAPVGKKEQSTTAKPNPAAGAAPSSVPRAVSKADARTENVTGKRASIPGKVEEAKSVTGSSNGDRVQSSIPIPSKPLVNGTSNPTAGNRQHGAKPQANGVHAGKGQQSQNSTRSRSHQGNAGRANGQASQNGAGQKKLAPQRLPSADDFPALSNGQGATATASASAPATNANGVTKANFSAILSAPAPVKKQPEPVKESESAAADDKSVAAAAASSSNGEAKEATTAINETEPKTNATKQASANGLAAPMLDFAAVVQSNPVAV